MSIPLGTPPERPQRNRRTCLGTGCATPTESRNVRSFVRSCGRSCVRSFVRVMDICVWRLRGAPAAEPSVLVYDFVLPSISHALGFVWVSFSTYFRPGQVVRSAALRSRTPRRDFCSRARVIAAPDQVLHIPVRLSTRGRIDSRYKDGPERVTSSSRNRRLAVLVYRKKNSGPAQLRTRNAFIDYYWHDRWPPCKNGHRLAGLLYRSRAATPGPIRSRRRLSIIAGATCGRTVLMDIVSPALYIGIERPHPA